MIRNRNMNDTIEVHPWEAYVPENARVLIMGTFPPQPKRWSMNFYYPNRTNDFWPIMAHIFLGNRNALTNEATGLFDLDAIKRLLTEKGIALSDTGRRIRRLAGNASDKFLEIVEPVNLGALLERMPGCRAIASTGEKAAGVISSLTSTPMPRIGESVTSPTGISIWRMPSTSRAYPMKLENKAAFYERMFSQLGML